MEFADKQKIIAGSVLFKGAPREASYEAAERAECVSFVPGELLLSGEGYVGLIVSGYAQVVKPGRDGAVTMSLLGSGDIYGAATLMGGVPPKTEVRAVKNVTVLKLREEDFVLIMERYFAVTKNYCRYLIGRIRFLTERVECMAGGTAAEKLWRYVEKNAENGSLHLSFGMDALASALSLSRASLYRAFDELEKDGKLSRKGHEIRIL